MDSESSMLITKAEAWLAKDPDEVMRTQLEDLLKTSDEKALRKAFSNRLTFGTAGLRGVMGVGPSNMNVGAAHRS